METLGPITIVISESQTVDLDYESELKLSEEEINAHLMNQPSLYVYYAVLEEMAEAAMAEVRLHLELTEAALDEKYRKEITVRGGKITEAMVSGAVRLDSEHIAAVSDYNQARKNVGILSAIKEAFRHRKDCLIALASNMRAQMDTTLSISKRDNDRGPELPV